MAKSQQTFNKAEREKQRLKKKKEKLERREKRKSDGKKINNLDDMIAYVDENGMITDTPPDPEKKKKFKLEDSQISTPKKEYVEYDPVRTGIVEFYNDDKGFGFIKDLENSEKYFYHVNGTIEEVAEGNKVTFELEQGKKGMNAVKVQKAK